MIFYFTNNSKSSQSNYSIMEIEIKILSSDRQPTDQILSQIKEHLLAGSILKIVLITKKASIQGNSESHPSLKLPPNKYRKQIIDEKLKIIHEELLEKIEEIEYLEEQALPKDRVGKLQDLYKEEKYEEIVEKVMKDAESNFLITSDPNITFILGNCFFKLRKYSQAIEYYKIESENQSMRRKANRLNNLATCLAQTNQNQQSLKVYTQALKYYAQVPELDRSNLLFNIGNLYKNSRMFEKAEEYYNESLIQRQIKSPYNEKMLYDTHIELGKVQKELEKYEESISNYLFGINYSKKNSEINPIKVLKELCLVYEKNQKWSEALNYYEFLSDEYEKRGINQGYIYEKVANIHQKLKNFILSAKFLKKSYAEYRKDGNQRKMSDISSSLLAAEEFSKIEQLRQNRQISSKRF